MAERLKNTSLGRVSPYEGRYSSSGEPENSIRKSTRHSRLISAALPGSLPCERDHSRAIPSCHAMETPSAPASIFRAKRLSDASSSLG